MLLLLSPAKRLNEQFQAQPLMGNRVPQFFTEAVKVNASLKRNSAKKLAALQNISAELAALNHNRNQIWNTQIDAAVYYPAIQLFNGDAYLGLDASTLDRETIQYAEDHLRILSGLYGFLKPLDLIEPYRLEMGTALKVRRSENLYAFWQKKITQHIKKQFPEETIINLASKEYAKAVDFKQLTNQVIDLEFKDRNSKGEYKVMSFYAKKARGMMARYILQNRIETAEEIKGFDMENYWFSANDSSSHKLVFLRDH